MKHTNISISFAALAAISLSPCLFGQDDSATTKPAQAQSPDYCSMSKILGAKVRMSPGVEAKQEAQKDGEAAKGPEGKIDDVLIDARNGSLQYAVLSFGGFVGIGDKTVAVPCSALTWNKSYERFELAASEDRLKAMPAFDLSKARKSGLDKACETVQAQWRTATGATVEASGTTGAVKEATATKKVEAKPLTGTSFYLIPNRFVSATEIEGFPVYTGGEKFGKISDLLVDRHAHTLALAIVKRGGTLGIGGTEYLVPFCALHSCTSGEERVLCLNCESSAMETAVVYEKPKDGIVEAEAAKRALACTGLDRGIDKSPVHDKVKEDKGR